MPLTGTFDWSKLTNVDNVTTRGASIKEILIKRLNEFDNRYDYGRCSPEDLPKWLAEQWQPLKWDQFGAKNIDDFNSGVGLRLGIRADLATGYVMHRKNIICIMDKKHRERVLEARKESFERRYAQSMAAQTQLRTETLGDDSPQQTQIRGGFESEKIDTRDKKAMRDLQKDWTPVQKG